MDPLAAFSPVTRRWFTEAFAAATPAQTQAWASISAGEHTLVVAPTGSGKTLAAFLWAIDRTLQQPVPDLPSTSVLYVSPLKALAVDVDRNLRAPLHGIARVSGSDVAITTGVRTGDTSPNERRRLISHPPDILITTPESLYLMLTSAARSTLSGVHTVIIDEVHAVAATKRGSHLALSLERLSEITELDPQRIGLSATVTPTDVVGGFLCGDRPVRTVQPSDRKTIELSAVVPVEDLAHPPAVDSGPAEEGTSGPTIWPHVHEAIVDAIASHRSTLVFANSRRLAERLTTQVNEIWWSRHPEEDTRTAAPLARAHHGSVSKERRTEIEDALKAGELRAVVATSSLELGIDMGAVDLVIQVQAPPSVANGLQRVGRAGHQVGAVSRALLFPTHRGDLLATAVAMDRMRAGDLEPIRPPRHPLDVLAQQVIAMVAMQDWSVPELLAVVRRAGPYRALPDSAFEGVLDMLAGRYPSEDFATLRPRLVWDRHTGTLSARPGAQRLAVTSGGTIPDRGLFGVFLAGGQAGTRVGELDEEMVYESRVGDVFALGSSHWRIEEITRDRVLVVPAPGQPARLPFWHGDAMGRPVEMGRAIGRFIDAFDDAPAGDPGDRDAVELPGLDLSAARNLAEYLQEQQEATGVLPGQRRIVVEQFRDGIGDRRVVIHSPLGARVHSPWALILTERMRDRYGIDAQVMAADDGIVMRLPDDGSDEVVPTAPLDLTDLIFADPATVMPQVRQLVGGSALFASRFRECSSRALLFGRRDPAKRTPLWQQRQRSSQLLSTAARFDSFPIVLETVREVLQDVYDVEALTDLLRDVADGSIDVTTVRTSSPSPFARSLLFGYVAQFLYEGDSPLAERRSAALALDESLLTELLGSADLRDLLDRESLAAVERRLQRRGDRAATDAESAADVLRAVGPIAEDELHLHGITPEFLQTLVAARRAVRYRHHGKDWACSVEDSGLLRDALGVALPAGIAEAHLDPRTDALADLLQRYARTHGPFTAADVVARHGIGAAIVDRELGRQGSAGRLLVGAFRPGGSGQEWCHPDTLRAIRRASAAKYRQEVEPIEQEQFAGFPARWHRISDVGTAPRERGSDGLMAAIEQLAGAPMPASQLESLILPSRVRDYTPAMLDELTASGAVTWWGIDELRRDAWLALAPTDLAPSFLPPTPDDLPTASSDVLNALAEGGGWFSHQLASRMGVPRGELEATLRSLCWAGLVTNDSIAPVRAGLRPAARTSPSRSRPARQRMRRVGSPLPPSGRWSALPPSAAGTTEAALQRAEMLLVRHGVVTRGAVTAERTAFGAAYKALAALEDRGHCRRGYFVEGLGGAQFGLAAAIDSARAGTPAPQVDLFGKQPESSAWLLASADPANPFGAAIPWPQPPAAAHPGRKAGAWVVTAGTGAPIVYGESTGGSLLVWDGAESDQRAAAGALIAGVRTRRIRPLRVMRINGRLWSDHEFADLLAAAGAHSTPGGLRVRR